MPGRAYGYELEAVDVHGRSTFFGLVEVEVPGLAVSPPGRRLPMPLLIPNGE